MKGYSTFSKASELVWCHTQDTRVWVGCGLLLLYKGAVGVLYIPNQQVKFLKFYYYPIFPFFYNWFGLVCFYGISTIVGYQCQIHFYTYKKFNFKQFSLALVHNFNVKKKKTVPCKRNQSSISIQFQCQKPVLFQTSQFGISKQFKSI